MREGNAIKKRAEETKIPTEDGEDSDDAASQSDGDGQKGDGIALVKQDAVSDEIKATVRIKSVRTVTTAGKKMKE